ncbi:MAG: toll/interleukin-1 receptor domain-containing protein, partial [Muribaculaceae bacterium]|nr:toll/interleukin-1 receptor domain-containing protein [Muribaculaceae bacterium]
MDKYDVFISCKSEDYVYAEDIYTFLRDNGINAFLTSKELRSLGESEYRKAITSVLKDVEHIIVFASKAEYIDS